MGLRFIALACLVGAAIAGPVQRQSESEFESESESERRCVKQCPIPKHLKFPGYEVGKAYSYRYVSENNVTYVGSKTERARIEATVEFHIRTRCEGVMKMKDVRIQQKMSMDEKEELKKKLELPLIYGYIDGKFLQVCPSSEESTQSLNMKRAAISALVNEMKDLGKDEKVIERDSLGTCPTKYTVQKGRGKVIIKEKNLKACSSRKTNLIFLEKELPSSLLMEDDHLKCEQHISDGFIKKSYSRETSSLRKPFGNKASIIKFSGSITITHTETKPADKHSEQEPVNREDIEYSVDEPREGDRNVKEVERILKNMCSKNKLIVDITASKDFMRLLSLGRSLSYNQHEKIYESLKDGTLCDSKKVRDIYSDTLPIIQTDAAIKLMVKILLNEDVTFVKSKVWRASFALKQNPTEETMAAVAPLLKKDKSASTLMGVINLVRRFCKANNCEQSRSVDKIVEAFNQDLGSGCSNDDETQIMTALRALGNAGYHGKAHENIVACAKDSSKPIRVRLAAIDTFR